MFPYYVTRTVTYIEYTDNDEIPRFGIITAIRDDDALIVARFKSTFKFNNKDALEHYVDECLICHIPFDERADVFEFETINEKQITKVFERKIRIRT